MRCAPALVLLATLGCGFLRISRFSRADAGPLELAPKPAPVDSEYDGCGEAGSQPDYPLNRRKNRIDEGAWLPVAWRTIAELPWPRSVGYRFRNQWTRNESREVARYEGVAVQVEGYLVGERREGPEPTNCYQRDADDRDFHMWLSEAAHGSEKRSIVVEITPRVRAARPGWTAERLDSLVRTQARLRVRGWLMLDQAHPELVGVNRVTLWEVHPVMHIDVRDSTGKWRAFDR